ncbi:aspartyl protease family protein [Nonlabens tegetincola]|uniref:aspartyl protease family protein n=1 Tax=Nonlabens tegetincola TaxID=323273 RepID=UPI000CF49A12|nr:aspartyl protease family protein [Nonlabens tegetincola]
MVKKILFFIVFIQPLLMIAQQDYFTFKNNQKKIFVEFDNSGGLIIVPIELNGTKLNFMLDTGASKNIIYNLNGIDSLEIKKGKQFKLKGYGNRNGVNAYVSDNNVLKLGDYVNEQARIFILAEEQLSLFNFIGVEINGVIGASFFKNAVVKIDYEKNYITLTQDIKYLRGLRRYDSIPIQLSSGKPYIKSEIVEADNSYNADVLIDTGSNDALWINKRPQQFKIPEKNFYDFLGFGLNGEISGYRTKLDQLNFGSFNLQRITSSFPDIKESKLLNSKNLLSSIGAEVLKRFFLILDYRNNTIYLQNTRKYRDGFYYNMSGITAKLGKREIFYSYESKAENGYGNEVDAQLIQLDKPEYDIVQIPGIYIDQIRVNSEAEKAGLQVGDQIVKINGRSFPYLTLNEVNDFFYTNPHSTIRITIKRNGKQKRYKFKLIPLID